MSKPLDQHKTAIGTRRKQVVKAALWARDASCRCRTDADRAGVLAVLVGVVEEYFPAEGAESRAAGAGVAKSGSDGINHQTGKEGRAAGEKSGVRK